jgi:YcxB-like protein
MIETTYAISQNEFSEAQKIWCSRELKKLPGRWLIQTVGILLGGFIGWSFKYLPLWLVLAIAALLLAQVAVSMWRKKAIRRYQYSMNAERFQEVEVWIDESGYRDRKSGECEGWIAWKSFTGWRESADVFVLGRDLTFVTVPKRALNPMQQEELRAILKTRLG